MNEMQVRQLLDSAADVVSTEPPRDLLQVHGRQASSSRFIAWSGVAAAVVLAAVVLVVIEGSNLHGDDPRVGMADTSGDQELTDQQFALATRLARSTAEANNDGTVSKATATLTEGRVLQTNTGHQCTSGELLTVNVFGTFPHANVIGRLGASEEDLRVTGQRLIADPVSGVVCQQSSLVGDAVNDPAATVLFETDGSQ